MCLAHVCWLCKPSALGHLLPAPLCTSLCCSSNHMLELISSFRGLAQVAPAAGWPAEVCAPSCLPCCSPTAPAALLHQPWHREEIVRQGKGRPGVIAAETQLLRRLGVGERGSHSCTPGKDSKSITTLGERTLLSNAPVQDHEPMGLLPAEPRRPQRNSWGCMGV